MANGSKVRPALRQKIRRALLIFSFIPLPVTFAYISCPLITESASKGIATGGLFVFALLFIGSLFVGRPLVRLPLPCRRPAGDLRSGER